MKQTSIILCLIFITVFIFASCGNKDDSSNASIEKLSEDASKLVQELSSYEYKAAIKNHNYSFVMRLLTGKKTLKTIWESLEKQYGEFVDIYEYEYIDATDFDNIIIKVAFQNQSVDFKVTYNKNTDKISGLHYNTNEDNPALAGAKMPQPPDGILEESFYINSGDYSLPAMLAYPEGDGQYPLVILVHGSGPNNMNESIGKQAPFRDIAWGLAKQGVATLRYDKRTLVYPESFDETSTVEDETIIDAIAAYTAARTLPEVNPSQIFVLGHSLGGMMIPRIAESTPEANGFIMMAAPVTPLHELIVLQYEYLFNLDGKLSISERISLFKANNMKNRVEKLKEGSTINASKLFNINPAYWIYLKDYDVLDSVQAISSPLLIIQGASDYQVTMDDFNALDSALSSKDNVTLISYPDLGHLMTQAGAPPSPDDYYQEFNVSQEVIDDIADFVNSN